MPNVYVRNPPLARVSRVLFTDTCVTSRSHNERMAGRKPESFTDAENAALRTALQALCDERGWKTAEAGRQLDITQQSASRLLNKRGGWSRPTAEKLARLLGADGANAILRTAGAMANPMTVPQGWSDRDLAVSIARRYGYEEEVIRRVVVKYQDDHNKSRNARWWNDRIVIESAEYKATRDAEPVTTPSSAPKAKPAKEPRRRDRKAS
jgi:transcriptional regulator with XRE-family HTH domain